MTAVLQSNNKENLRKVIDFAIQIGVAVNLQKKNPVKKTDTIIKNSWNFISANKNRSVQKKEPVFGCAKGKMWFADDFDAPLEGFEEYM